MAKKNIALKKKLLSERARIRKTLYPNVKSTEDAKIENENFDFLQNMIYTEAVKE